MTTRETLDQQFVEAHQISNKQRWAEHFYQGYEIKKSHDRPSSNVSMDEVCMFQYSGQLGI